MIFSWVEQEDSYALDKFLLVLSFVSHLDQSDGLPYPKANGKFAHPVKPLSVRKFRPVVMAMLPS